MSVLSFCHYYQLLVGAGEVRRVEQIGGLKSIPAVGMQLIRYRHGEFGLTGPRVLLLDLKMMAMTSVGAMTLRQRCSC
jgi:hypothetical protein